MFDFRLITLFCLEKRLSKHKIFLKIWEGMAPLAPLATPMLRSPKGCKNIPGNANEGLTKLCKNLLKHASKSS